jgi:hypothetical protein
MCQDRPHRNNDGKDYCVTHYALPTPHLRIARRLKHHHHPPVPTKLGTSTVPPILIAESSPARANQRLEVQLLSAVSNRDAHDIDEFGDYVRCDDGDGKGWGRR